MASLVNPFNINGNYPIAGQDNDSQGFRDNFTNIKNNFYYIKSEVEDLQNKAILKTALAGSTLNNDFQSSQVKNIQTKNQSETVYDWGTVGGVTATEIQLDLALGNIHKLNATGSIQINSVIKSWPGSLQYSRLLFYITINSSTNTLTMPTTLTTDLSAVPGLRTVSSQNVITFQDTGNYIFEFSSADSGTTVFVRELTKGNPAFKDQNFYMSGIGGYALPTLRVGWSNLFAISNTIDRYTKANTDVISVRGAYTSYMNYDTAYTLGGNDPTVLNTAGFSVAKSRTADPGAGSFSGTEGSSAVVQVGDYLGYFNGLGFTKDPGDNNFAYQPLATIGIFANGSTTGSTYAAANSLGGNVVIYTKRENDVSFPAVSIDSLQNVTMYGNLDVKGTTTYIESTVVSIKDKNLLLGVGTTTRDLADLSALQIQVTSDPYYANIAYFGPSHATSKTGGYGEFNFNHSVNIFPRQTYVSSLIAVDSTGVDTGALVVSGGVGITANVFTGANLSVAGTLDATSTTWNGGGASILTAGGIAAAKNIIAGKNIYANATTAALDTITGALVVAGGAGIAGNLIVGGTDSTTGQQYGYGGIRILSTTAAGTSSTGALQVAGGAGILGNVFLSAPASANGVIVSSTLNVLAPMIGAGGTTPAGNAAARGNTAALRVKGGTILEGNVVIGTGSGTSGRLYIDYTGANATPGLGLNADGTFNRDSGAVILGNATNAVGMTVSGDIYVGVGASYGGIYILRTTGANPTPTTVSGGVGLTPFVPSLTGGKPVMGAITALGGSQFFGDMYIGQPHGIALNSDGTWPGVVDPNTGKPSGANSGNLYLRSGARTTSYSTGALVLGNVMLADASYSPGGLGMYGNLWVAGNVVLGTPIDPNSNVSVLSASQSFSANTGAVTISGGLGVYGNINVGVGNVKLASGNIVVASGTTSTSLTSGAMVITSTGGMAVGGNIYAGGNVYITSTATSSGNLTVQGNISTVAGNIQIGSATGGLTMYAPRTGVNGNLTSTTGLSVYTNVNNIVMDIGPGGVINFPQTTISTPFNGENFPVVMQGNVKMVGNLYVNGTVQPINAIGASGIALVSAVNTPQTLVSTSGGVQISNLQFVPEAGKNYLIESVIFHVPQTTAQVKGFGINMVQTSGGFVANVMIEQQTAQNLVFAVGNQTISATGTTWVSNVTVTATTQQITRITGTLYNPAGAVGTVLQLYGVVAAGMTGGMIIGAQSYLKWTKLN